MQCPLDTFGIARDDGEVSFGRLVRLRTALLPIPQSAQRDVVAQGKLLLRQREGAAEGLNAWHGAQLPGPRFGEGRVFRIADGAVSGRQVVGEIPGYRGEEFDAHERGEPAFPSKHEQHLCQNPGEMMATMLFQSGMEYWRTTAASIGCAR